MQSSPFRARLPLPDLPLPTDTVCYKVVLPNSPRILEAFEGQIQLLSQWVYWERGDNHAAKVAAKVFRDLYARLNSGNCNHVPDEQGEIEDCMKLRISSTNSCIIECFDECSQTWGTWLDVSQCAPGAVSQQGPGGTPTAGQENCYDVVLNANNQWRSPVPVKDGDTVTISLASGGWSGDTLNWHCPNGNNYLLGACTTPGSTVGTDPAPSLAHMRLIASLDGSTWQDAYNTTLVIPAGQAATNLLIQANDSNITDNVGSVNFRVCITTNNPTGWTYDVDFTATSGGWHAYLTSAAAHYVLGTGWQNNAPGSGAPEDMNIAFTTLHSGVLTSFSATVAVSATHQSYEGATLDYATTELARNNSLAETPGGTLTFTGSQIYAAGQELSVRWNISASPLGTATCTHVHCAGTGTNPFV